MPSSLVKPIRGAVELRHERASGRKLAVREWLLLADIVEKVGCRGVGLLLIHFIFSESGGTVDVGRSGRSTDDAGEFVLPVSIRRPRSRRPYAARHRQVRRP